MSFPRYPCYKASGVEWLGDVPEHWPLVAVRRALSHIEQGWSPECHSRPAEDDEWGVLKSGCVNHGQFSQGDNKALPAELEPVLELEVRSGDLLMSRASGSPQLVGSTALVKETRARLLLSDKVFRLHVTSGIAPEFLAWAFNSVPFRWQVECAISGADGLANNLPQSSLRAFLCPTPSVGEQHAIVAFLDYEVAKIDALVAEQHRLIELLKEKRQAVISHAVTKGLNSDAPMKPSGVEWLGDVPAHWGVGQSRRLFALRNERAYEDDRQLTASQEYGVIYQDDFVRIEGRRVVEVIKGADILKHVEPRDFVISMRSFQGGIEWCQLRGCISSAYVMLKPGIKVNCRYFSFLLKSQSYIQALQSTTNLVRDGQALRYGNFTQVDLPLVHPDEQAAIATFLERETAKMDTLTAEAERAIALLQERRTALISAAVTGQIDVRGLAASEVV